MANLIFLAANYPVLVMPFAVIRRTKKQPNHPKAIEARARVNRIIDEVAPEDLVEAIKRAPSLRGIILGYIAEEMFERHVLREDPEILEIVKHDDHDRSKNKSDREFVYRGRKYKVQLKSIQTNSICWREDLQLLHALVQNDASDRRTITLPNGERIETTNYKIGDYDILAVPLFPFTGDWTFAYKRNRDCRPASQRKYPEAIRRHLLSTTEEITFPLSDAWFDDLIVLLDDSLGEPIRVIDIRADE